MASWLRRGFQAATAVLVVVSAASLIPFVGPTAPAYGQFGQFGSFQGTCPGFNFGGFGQFGGCAFGSGFNGQFGGQFGNFGGQFGGQFGGFVLATPQTTVTVGETVPLIFGWMVPEPATWREMRNMEVRIRDGKRIALWVRWDERTNTFVAVAANGQAQGPRYPPGRNVRISTRWASLDLTEALVEDTGPQGDSVAVQLPVRFATAAAPRTYQIEAGASADSDAVFFGSLGRIVVER